MPRKYTPQERVIAFWNKVAVTADDNQCWLWLARCNKQGYGLFRIFNNMVSSHRVAWMYPDYVIPDGMFILHSCDNPSCCNPKHLFLGTHQDNMEDMKRKGRQKSIKGQLHKGAKLSDDQVIEIRNLYATGTISQEKLGYRFGISQVHIGRIVNHIFRKG